MYRRYNITINLKKAASEWEEKVIRIFGCSVTEPSNWVEYGGTIERGLTFLDYDGKELDSPVFEHQPVFYSLAHKEIPEKEEIRELVCQALSKHYQLPLDDVSVLVVEV